MRIGAVIFDMDGLMLDTEALVRPVMVDAAQACGYDLSSELFLQLIGRTNVDSERLLCEAFGPDFSAADFRQRCSTGWEAAIVGGIPHKPGLGRLLDLLERHGVAVAVATSTARDAAERSLAIAGLRHRFEVVVTGDQIANGKPAPDIFLLAAERLGVEPARCLVLEDSHAGVRAAHAAGCMPIMVPDLVPATDDVARLALHVVASLDDVAELLVAALDSTPASR
jgi:beta-phosphoglucomutase-like phosphatase (HAD superfamily)